MSVTAGLRNPVVSEHCPLANGPDQPPGLRLGGPLVPGQARARFGVSFDATHQLLPALPQFAAWQPGDGPAAHQRVGGMRLQCAR